MRALKFTREMRSAIGISMACLKRMSPPKEVLPQQDLSLLASVVFFIGTPKGVVDRMIAAQ